MSKMQIPGDWFLNGFFDHRAVLLVDVEGAQILEAEYGENLRFEQWGRDAPILTHGAQMDFLPDEIGLKRLERAGFRPKQMIEG